MTDSRRPVPDGGDRTRGEIHRIRTSSQWERARYRVLDRDGWMCRAVMEDGSLCGNTSVRGRKMGSRWTWVNRLDVHHVIPLAQGGAPYDSRNLVTVCRRCHGAVEHGHLKDWSLYEAAKRGGCIVV